MTTRMHLSRLHFPVTTLGPGRRVGIWLQGCSIRCPGCISTDTWAVHHGSTTVEAVLNVVGPWLANADGITVSGGEPFDQPEALLALLTALRAHWRGDVLLFTGYAREAIETHLAEMTGLIDALVSDPFDIDAPQTLALRGSDNQRLHFLTPLGRDRFAAYERASAPTDRRFDLMFDGNSVWLAGIPRRGDFERMRYLLEQQGHSAVTSEDRSLLQVGARGPRR